MNYDPNTTRWRRGDFVLHDMDAKRHDMLMYVYEVRGDQVKTVYIDPKHDHCKRGTGWVIRQHYVNDFKVLHDPKRFGIDVMQPGKRGTNE